MSATAEPTEYSCSECGAVHEVYLERLEAPREYRGFCDCRPGIILKVRVYAIRGDDDER